MGYPVEMNENRTQHIIRSFYVWSRFDIDISFVIVVNRVVAGYCPLIYGFMNVTSVPDGVALTREAVNTVVVSILMNNAPQSWVAAFMLCLIWLQIKMFHGVVRWGHEVTFQKHEWTKHDDTGRVSGQGREGL